MLEAIWGDLTVSQPVAKHGVHLTPIDARKMQAIKVMAGIFSGNFKGSEASHQGEVEKLHAMIGQLVVERNFLREASAR